MRIVLLGDAVDVRGFALAGVHGRVCRDVREAEAALAGLAAEDADVGLLLVSATVARLSARTIERLRAQERGPAVVVLPDWRAGCAPSRHAHGKELP